MSFLVKSDYSQLIREDNLNIVTGTDDNLLEIAELAAQSEMESYLNTRYDIVALFPAVTVYDITATYAVGDLVETTSPAFALVTVYAPDALVSWTDGCVYKQINAGSTSGTEDPTDAAFWLKWAVQGKVYAAIVTGPGAKPLDVASFGPDTRQPLAVRFMIDIVLYELHSRINPRKLPEHRITRRDDALMWLGMVSDPRKGINPPFAEKVFEDLQDTQGSFGHNAKQTHRY